MDLSQLEPLASTSLSQLRLEFPLSSTSHLSLYVLNLEWGKKKSYLPNSPNRNPSKRKI